MRNLLVALILSMPACGSDDPPAKYQTDCSCDIVCDGQGTSYGDAAMCMDQDDIDSWYATNQAACDLVVSENCTTGSCTCHCFPGDEC